jgi:hypothetical protein
LAVFKAETSFLSLVTLALRLSIIA